MTFRLSQRHSVPYPAWATVGVPGASSMVASASLPMNEPCPAIAAVFDDKIAVQTAGGVGAFAAGVGKSDRDK